MTKQQQKDQAWADFIKVEAPAKAEYLKTKDAKAEARYDKITDPAYAAYEKKIAKIGD